MTKLISKFVILLLIIIATFAISSCSKCYECKAPIEIKTPDTTYVSYQSTELCTASKNELEDKKSQGYICD